MEEVMQKPKFFSWEFLDGKVVSPYEAVIVTAKESRRINSVPYELQADKKTKITTQAAIRLVDGKVKFTYLESEK